MNYWIHYSSSNWQPAENRNTMEEARKAAEKHRSQWQSWCNRDVHWRIYYGDKCVAASSVQDQHLISP